MAAFGKRSTGTDGRTVPDADAGAGDYGQAPDCRSQAAAGSPVVCAGC